ncbi:ligand-binding sensor domain-containing diguanylate cyclase [Granulicella sibirica]|uniref:diguanylate cyclase n=1 Tax=Granulicella sibirica TaxID=2479048 RepID=A0A4Q0SUP5_9BACT|nr:ligand-binding sensor domain-containing diguanylate cyclase [Granulicella sibirica]RXH54755.1 putative sensor protein [Granulicella sibirica]
MGYLRKVRVRRAKYLATLLIVLVSFSSVIFASESKLTQYTQTELTDRNGLPQNSVASVTQTRDGYLWFGTQEGFARFDGIRFTVFNTLNSRGLKDNYIQLLASGLDGSVWIGTRSGLTRYREGVFRSYITADTPLTTLFASRDGSIWVGSAGRLYSVKDDQVRLYGAKDGLPCNDIRGIAETPDGTMWFATAQGLMSLKDGRFRLYTTTDGLPDSNILRIVASHNGSLWLATPKGIAHWDPGHGLLENIATASMPSHARISSLLVDHEGMLWVAFMHSGIASFSKGSLTGYTHRDGLPSDDVSAIYEDRANHLWIGLAEGGAVELREGLFESFGEKEGLSENMIWTVLQARDGSVWVGTNSTGLNHVTKDGKVRVFTTRDGLPDGSVNGLSEARDGSLWIGSEHGILSRLFNGHITSFRDAESPDARIASILEDRNGDLWLSFHELNGLVRFHDGKFEHYKSPGLLNTSVFAPDGSIWLGSDHGGVTHFSSGTFTSYTTANGLLSNFAQAIYVDPEGVTWAGTSPGGLNRIKDGKITTYSVAQGLFDLTVGAIVEDDSGNLWMTCNKGIFRVSKKELNDYADGKISSIHSIVYGTPDGMRVAECNFGASPSIWKGENGRLWFATVAGVASIDPRLGQVVPSPPPATVESVVVNQKVVPFQREVIAGPESTDLEIQFTAPDFVAPERIRFRYRLRGFDPNWVEVGPRRQAFYTRLPPGHYFFEVQAAHGEGEWGPSAPGIKLRMTPHFWQTGWFRLSCGLLLILISVVTYRIRTGYLVRRNAELEQRVLQRTAELQKATRAAEAAQAALHEQATRDGLTRVWNRRSIFEILEREIDRSRREDGDVCVVMADLDHFKQVNDTHGHQAGDCVLQEVARRISGLMRPYDSVGRYGGEEFLIVLPGCTQADAFTRAEEFRQAVYGIPIPFGQKSVTATCSFGLAAAVNAANCEEMVAAADEALYVAKRTGRNKVHVYAIEESLSTIIFN